MAGVVRPGAWLLGKGSLPARRRSPERGASWSAAAAAVAAAATAAAAAAAASAFLARSPSPSCPAPSPPRASARPAPPLADPARLAPAPPLLARARLPAPPPAPSASPLTRGSPTSLLLQPLRPEMPRDPALPPPPVTTPAQSPPPSAYPHPDPSPPARCLARLPNSFCQCPLLFPPCTPLHPPTRGGAVCGFLSSLCLTHILFESIE